MANPSKKSLSKNITQMKVHGKDILVLELLVIPFSSCKEHHKLQIKRTQTELG